MTQWAEKGNVLFCVQAKELKKKGGGGTCNCQALHFTVNKGKNNQVLRKNSDFILKSKKYIPLELKLGQSDNE